MEHSFSFWCAAALGLVILASIPVSMYLDYTNGWHEEDYCLSRMESTDTTCAWNSSLTNCYNPGECEAKVEIQVRDGCEVNQLDGVTC